MEGSPTGAAGWGGKHVEEASALRGSGRIGSDGHQRRQFGDGIGVCSVTVLLQSEISTFGSSGSGAGQMVSPQGVAVQPASGNVYVADTGNDRIDVFGPTGTFIEAFAWGVADGAPKAEVCTTSCQAGIAGSGPGQFSTPTTIAVGAPPGPAANKVFVGDAGNNAVETFDADGHFISAIDGTSTPSGAFPEPGRGGSGQERQPLDGRRFHEQRRRVRRARRFREPVDRLPRFAQRYRRRLRSRFRLPDDPIPIRLLFRLLRRRHRAVDLDRYLRRARSTDRSPMGPRGSAGHRRPPSRLIPAPGISTSITMSTP